MACSHLVDRSHVNLPRMTDRHKYSYDVDLADENTAATKVIRLVGARKRVLEVGAGPGSISRVLKHRFGCHVTAVELDPAAVRELETFCDRVYRRDLNQEDWADALAGDAAFDVVIAADVLEHLIDPLAALRSLTALLSADGHVVVSLPNATHSGLVATLLEGNFRYGDWGLLDRTHVRFFGPRNVDALLEAADLDIVAREYVTRPPLQTEFADCWSRLDPEQRAALSRRPDGNVYQIVVKAKPKRSTASTPEPGAAERGGAPTSDAGASSAGRAETGAPVDPAPGAALPELMLAASARQETGDLEHARRLFLRTMAEYGENFDALHMLGVIELEQDNARLALDYLRRALALLRVDFPPFFRNLGLCLAALQPTLKPSVRHASAEVPQKGLRVRHGIDLPSLPAEPPLVSVVVTVPSAACDAADAIASVQAQTYSNVELIVATAGADAGGGARPDGRFPTRFVQTNADQPGARLNQCIEAARGQYVVLLDGDDRCAPVRIEHAVRALSACGARWGFSNVAFIDGKSRAVGFGEHAEADAAMRAHEALYGRLTLSEGLMHDGVLVDAGNLFFERSLWREVGGFGPVRFNVCWLFALTVSILAEPVYVDEPDYIQRVDSRPPGPGAEARDAEANLIRDRWLNHLDAMPVVPNKLLEQAKRLRRQYDFAIMRNGGGHLLDRTRLLRYLQEMLGERPSAAPQTR